MRLLHTDPKLLGKGGLLLWPLSRCVPPYVTVSFVLLKIFILVYVYGHFACICLCNMCMPVAHGRHWISERKVQKVVTATWILGTELQYSERAVGPLNCWDIFPVLWVLSLCFLYWYLFSLSISQSITHYYVRGIKRIKLNFYLLTIKNNF